MESLMLAPPGTDAGPTVNGVFPEGSGQTHDTVEVMEAELTADGLRLLADCLGHWRRRLLESPEALAACKARGWVASDLERLRVGYADGFLADAVAADERNVLHRMGLLDADGNEVLRGRLIVPRLTESGKLESVEALPIDGVGRKLITFHTSGSTELADDGALSVLIASVQYSVKGWRRDHADYRCLLKATNGSAAHVDRLDLGSAKGRSAFAKAFEAAGGPAADGVRADLLHVLQEIDRAVKLEASGRGIEPQMTAKEREEALKFLHGDILGITAADFEALGYIGEEDTKVLAYLVAISRKLPACLSMILQSSSGAGKSFLMELVAKLCPPEDALYFSRISAQSLYYMKPGSLRHKLVLVDERNGSEEADYSIRTLQTRKKLTLAIPVKDAASGQTETKVCEVEGPIAYLESTTRKVHPENASRAFVVSLEETPEQTAAILAAQRRQAAALPTEDDEQSKALVRRHQNAQRLLRPLPVIVPFAEKLKFVDLADPIRTRREHQRFLTLIQASALLHQHQRRIKNRGGVEYVEATPQDEAIARRLVDALRGRGHSELGDHAAALLRWLEEQPVGVELTRRQMQETLGWSYRKIRDAIDELCEHEFVVPLGRVPGQTYRYKLAVEPTRKGARK